MELCSHKCMKQSMYIHTQVHIYNLLFTHIHLITRIHIHARVDKEKRRYRSYIEIYISFSLYIYIYFTCDRDFIKRVKIFKERARI